MSSPSVVRPAGPDDRPEVWRLFRLHHSENALFPMSEQKVAFYLDRALSPGEIAADDMGPRGVVGVIGDAGALEGVIMLVLSSPWYTDQITLDDCTNYVDHKHRQSGHAKALIAYAKRMVDVIRAAGNPDFRMITGIVSTERTAAKIRLYERQGLQPVGAYFMYPPMAELIPIKNMHRVA